MVSTPARTGPLTHAEQIREGNVWVGVTAQKLGIVGGTNTLVASQVLKTADPVRYGPLEHPGDAFSYDIYSQVGKAVRADAGAVLGGLKPTSRHRRGRVAIRDLPHHVRERDRPIGEASTTVTCSMAAPVPPARSTAPASSAPTAPRSVSAPTSTCRC